MDNHNQLDPDLLSDLPLGIIEIILTFLPIRDAIRTSILSTKWRHKWISLPNLVFQGNGMGSSTSGGAIKRLKNFVTQTLFRHQGPIQKFKLHVSGMDSCPVTDQWLLFLSRIDIKELILRINAPRRDYFEVPSCLYSWRNLTFLELDGCRFSTPPLTFRGFLCLRSLILRFVDVPSVTIESLVSNSPHLENLECVSAVPSDLRISAPNLKSFSLACPYSEIYLRAPLLAKMSITLYDDDDNDDGYGDGAEVPLPKNSVCNYTEFLGGLTNLESLIGDVLFTKHLSIGIEYCCHPLVFHHLKVIRLCEVNFEDMNEILFVVRLIMDAANLRDLQVLIKRDEERASKTPDVHFWDSESPKNCTLKNLKTVILTDFRGALHEMKFVNFLLESSPVLETMLIFPVVQTTEQEILELKDELLSFRPASTDAVISVDQTLIDDFVGPCFCASEEDISI